MDDCPKMKERKGTKAFCTLLGAWVSERGICEPCRKYWAHGEPPESALENPVIARFAPCKEKRTNPLPGFFDMVKSFTTSMVKWITSGFQVASEETFKQRISICEACPHFNKPYAGMCGVCGCTGLKIHLKHERCILNKWGPEQ